MINEFVDLEAKGRRRRPGEVVELTDVRARKLAGQNLIYPEPEPEPEPESQDENPGSESQESESEQEPESEDAEFPKHLGGGYYELSNGEKVKGKEQALEAERALGGE